jgi:uncharacterized protein (DUF58 family)
MSGLLFDLAKLFPENADQWDLLRPSKALSVSLRAHVKRRFGVLQTAADMARIKEPTRLGVALRAYESGDPLRALSRNHLVRTNELLTRTDFAAGRRSCMLFFHAYENMVFASSGAHANKGQISLAVSALVEAIYESLAQTCVFRVVRERNIADVVSAVGNSGSRPDDVVVVTDLLFLTSSAQASTRALLDAFVQAGFRRACVFVVRDVLEHPVANKLGKQSVALRPFRSEDPNTEPLFSGEEYEQNLARQIEDLHRESRLRGVDVHVVTGRSTLEGLIDSVSSFVGSVM